MSDLLDTEAKFNQLVSRKMLEKRDRFKKTNQLLSVLLVNLFHNLLIVTLAHRCKRAITKTFNCSRSFTLL